MGKPRASISFYLCLFLISSFIFPSSFAFAQGTAYAEIGPPDISAFPNISTVLDVYDANGQFVSGLKPADLNAVEDGAVRAVQMLSEEPVGAQIVVGVNPAPAFDVRDGQGVSRYTRIQQTLGAWAASLPADSADDLSLVTIAGPIIAHTNAQSWLASFAAYQPNFKATTPNIQPLAFAVDTALTSNAQVGTKRAVLFITSHMEDASLQEALSNIGQRAVSGRVRIFIWFVDADLFFKHSSATLFEALAAQTGGAYATFTGLGDLPNPENYFAPLRRVYHLTYASRLTTAGEHSLSVEATLGATRVASAAQTFTLNIQPPNPILAALPAQITRGAPAEDPYNAEILVPDKQALNIIFDFPDGNRRPIVRTALFVDGQLVAENKTGAIDQFTWDLSAYTESGRHTLRVEATDNLGITGTSLDLPVDVTVIHPETGLLALIARNRQSIVWVATGLAGVILLGILLGGRLRRIPSVRERQAARAKYNDPLTQPIGSLAGMEIPRSPKKTRRRGKPLEAEKDAPARLIRLAADGQSIPANPIPLAESDVTLGTDPVQATFILDEPALSPLHARILRGETGFIISDQSSISGTWVNYEPVTRAGHPLKHGDRVHFGNLMYRFELKDPPIAAVPNVSPAEEG